MPNASASVVYRPCSQRLVDGIDHSVADFLHGVDGFLASGADIGNHALDVGFRARPGGVALGREDVGDLGKRRRRRLAAPAQIRLDMPLAAEAALLLSRGVLGVSRRLPNRYLLIVPDGSGHVACSTLNREILAVRANRAQGKVPRRRRAACISPAACSSGGNRWCHRDQHHDCQRHGEKRPASTPRQAQKASASRTARGLSVRRWPRRWA